MDEALRCTDVFSIIHSGKCSANEFNAFRSSLRRMGDLLATEKRKILEKDCKLSLLDITLKILEDVIFRRNFFECSRITPEIDLFNLKRDLVKLIANLSYEDVQICDVVSSRLWKWASRII
jgi:hypothetical protein